MVVEAERSRMDADEAAQVLGAEPVLSSPFLDMPW
jgi:hypothetical protein